MKKNMLSVLLVSFAAIMLMAFTAPQDKKKGEPWDIPEKYQKMENPHKGDKGMVRIGKMLYSKHCKSCHGNRGQGDGPRARQLETFPGDFTSEEFQERKAGVLYYQSFIGRDEMPNFEKEIPVEEDRWAIINYLRTFGE
ncbi:MAG: cytochrome c [Bacteroidales bacterium]|nr:cytochrome c [Bacteroidales bacterium]